MLADLVYPRGGWSRAAYYVFHRLRRLPDPPHRIARGVAVGVFVCFTPFYGLHFVTAAVIAYILQANLLAALLATFVGNPLTFPIIAAVSLRIGGFILGHHHQVRLYGIFGEFRRAFDQLWTNFLAIFTPEVTHWDQLGHFFADVFLPYLVGGLLPGVIAGVIAYSLTLPAVSAYQKTRIKRLKARYKKRQAAGLTKG